MSVWRRVGFWLAVLGSIIAWLGGYFMLTQAARWPGQHLSGFDIEPSSFLMRELRWWARSLSENQWLGPELTVGLASWAIALLLIWIAFKLRRRGADTPTT
jgi:hypothetical protein